MAGESGLESVTGVRVYADDLLGDVFGGAGSGKTEEAAERRAAPARDEAGRFARLVEQYWIERLHRLADDPEIQNAFGLSAREFGLFVHELTTAVHRTGLPAKLEENLRRTSGYGNIARERLLWKRISLAAGAVNAFVDWLGRDPRSENPQDRVVMTNGVPRTLFEPPPPVQGPPRINETREPYDRAWYRDWLLAFVDMLRENAGFDGERVVNVEQDALLKKILRDFT